MTDELTKRDFDRLTREQIELIKSEILATCTTPSYLWSANLNDLIA